MARTYTTRKAIASEAFGGCRCLRGPNRLAGTEVPTSGDTWVLDNGYLTQAGETLTMPMHSWLVVELVSGDPANGAEKLERFVGNERRIVSSTAGASVRTLCLVHVIL